jgi:hypothetical protein
MRRPQRVTLTLTFVAAAAACGGSSPAAPTVAASAAASATATPAPSASSLPAMYGHFYGANVSLEGGNVVLRATSVPDHPSPYFGAGHALYEAPHAGMQVNPNRIASQNLVFRVPASPTIAGGADTPMGPMGVAINGVALFNQYAAGRSPLDMEIPSFDRYNGHPQQQGQYHYHLEPLFLTAQGSSRLIGVLLDGFPVYGTRDQDGSAPSGLDVCNGHVAPTADFPQGIYHYHTVSAPPYIAGCFRGNAGTLG